MPKVGWQILLSYTWKDGNLLSVLTHFSIFAWRSHEQKSLAGYSSWGHKESDITEGPSLTHFNHFGSDTLSYEECEKWKGTCQLCSTLWDPMDCDPPGSSVRGVLWARTLEQVVTPFSRGSSWPRDWTSVSFTAGGFFTVWGTREALWEIYPSPFLHAHSMFRCTLLLRVLDHLKTNTSRQEGQILNDNSNSSLLFVIFELLCTEHFDIGLIA